MLTERPVGIDLGTTFSAAAWVDGAGHTNMIRNAEGDLLTPSVVLFGDEEVAVGKDARGATTVHPELVAQWVKRDMGLPFYTRPIHGQRLPPEVIQACILRKLKQDIVHTLGHLDRVVITVPAYFDEPRRKGTADAGEMAGLKVLDIVNEPTAAALSFGEVLGYLAPGAVPQREMTLLVYDLGGGTFDVTLLRMASGSIRTIATDGDVQLGGHDWDMRMAEYVVDQFQKKHKIDPRQDAAAMNRVLAAVIDAKHTLSARSHAIVRVDLAGRSLDVPVTREQFNEMTADLLERTAYTTRQVLAAAGMSWKDVSRLLLVGGSTRMPMVSEMLRQISGLEPDHTVNPDEAVARGAALYASYLLAKEAGCGMQADLEITNVNSHSLGVEGIDPSTLRKTNVVLIPRNTSLPKKVVERFVTKSENQRSIALQILEGESSLPGECTAIARTVVRNLPEGLPKNWPVEVTFEYGANGRLTVKAIVPGTEQGATLDLERAVGMSSDGIARWKVPVVAAAAFEEFEAMVADVLKQFVETTPEPMTPPEAEQASPSGTVAGAAAKGGGTPSVADLQPSPDIPVAPTPVSSVPPQAEGDKPDVVQPAAEAKTGEDEEPAKSPYVLPFPRWAFNLTGHIVFALIGLALGYLVLCWLRPNTFRLPW